MVDTVLKDLLHGLGLHETLVAAEHGAHPDGGVIIPFRPWEAVGEARVIIRGVAANPRHTVCLPAHTTHDAPLDCNCNTCCPGRNHPPPFINCACWGCRATWQRCACTCTHACPPNYPWLAAMRSLFVRSAVACAHACACAQWHAARATCHAGALRYVI